MNDTLLLALPIGLPILSGAILLPFLRKNAQALAWTTLLTVVITLLASLGLLSDASASISIPWLGFFDLSFGITNWKAFLIGFLFFFQILNSIYLLRSISRIPRPYLFAVFSLVAFGSACGAILAQNLLILVIGWQMVLVALYALILAGGDGTEPLALKALILNGASDFLMILGLMIYHHLEGSLNLNTPSHLATGASFATFASFVLMFLGAGARAGMWPFQTWIPEAAESMPVPGFAALPTALAKLLGIYFLFVICNDLFALSPAARTVMYVFAVATIYAAVIPALVERNFKKVLGLIAISSVGFMVAGMATSAAAGLAGALMLMLTQATYQSAMFYAAGNLEQSAGSASLEAIEGRKEILPYTVLGFLMAFMAAVALPPTGGFLGKQFIFEGLFEHHNFFVFFFVWTGAILNAAVFLKLAAVLLSDWKNKIKTDLGWTFVVPVLVLGAAALLGGFVMNFNSGLIGGVVGFQETEWMQRAWQISPVTMASVGVYVLGATLFFALRTPGKPEWSTFHFLRESPVLGRAYQLAEEKTFDAYEVGMKVINWIADVVFWRFERLIDRVAEWFIDTGRSIARPCLSTIHNGVYSNYLAWVVAGFALVSALVLLR
jgi:formate hydrogenlyase subunit 3/multisubunit Na+/H+ antiporter MnhD subunit